MTEAVLKTPYQRPPWPAAVAALLAYVALALSSGADIPLLGLGLALTASYAFQARFPNETLTKWTLRLVVMGTVLSGYWITATKDDNAFFDVRYLYSFALMSAAELALQFWRREPTGGARAPFTVFLSAVVFLVGCNTLEETSHYLWVLAPIYFLFFMLALPGFRQRLNAAALRYALAPVLAALIIGALTHATVARYKNELNLLGSQALPGRRLSPSMGMSGQPILGSSFTLRDSLTRVLRIDNPGPDPYLRGMTFDTYTGRTWGPSLDNRVFLALPRQPVAALGPKARYERLDDATGLLFAPLRTAAIVPEDAHPIDWAAQTNGPLRTPPTDTTSLTYDVTEGKSGLLDTPPTTMETARDLAVPPDIDRRVLLKAHTVGDTKKTPADKITAMVRFLQRNNSYSLTVDPGPGEPISNFILQRKAAHCEYFASAAVVMLRAAGVPTRYVSGYFAHEGNGRNALLVRQRDAHAWAESWVAGTGWVTVDATPGGGRPDALAGPIPLYWQVWEKLQDVLGAVRTWVLTAGWLQKGAVFLLLVLGLLVPQIYRYWKSRRAQESGFRYSSPDAALAALAARFEALLTRRGFPIPENRTWPEHLHAAEMEDSSAVGRFVQDYSRARFGPAPSRADIAEIERTLQTLEKKS